jgi:GT2 family glycosyltransferase
MDVPTATPLLAPASRSVRPRSSWPTAPRLSVVIVNYHNWGDTAQLVRQLCASPRLRRGEAEVVIVDNHSPTHPIVPHLRRLAQVSVRRWGRNRGFARAINEGCRLSRGDWLLFLNPDMALPPTFVEDVMARAEHLLAADPTAGIVGFRLHNPDGSRQLSTGAFPTLFGTLGRLFLPRPRRKYTIPPATERCRVDWVTGCCLLVRRACWDDLGGFDSSFFLYYEDVDLCRRARSRGWSVWHEPAPCALHHHPLHARKVPTHLRVVTRHALLTYARKHWSGWQFRALAGIVAAEAGVRTFLARCRGDGAAERDFTDLQLIANDLAAGCAEEAQRRLRRLVRREERRRVAAPVDRCAELQPAGLAPLVSG